MTPRAMEASPRTRIKLSATSVLTGAKEEASPKLGRQGRLALWTWNPTRTLVGHA